MIVHIAPMLLKSGGCVEGPTDYRGCGIVAACGRPGSIARSITRRPLTKLGRFVKDVLGCNNPITDPSYDPTRYAFIRYGFQQHPDHSYFGHRRHRTQRSADRNLR